MAVFSRRAMGYKLGVGLMMFSLMIFIAGFSSPYWYTVSIGLFHIHGGLWRSCLQTVFIKYCTDPHKSIPSWISVTQALQCMSLVCWILSIFYAVLVNWVQRKPKHTRLLEILASLASALGLAGTVLFIVQLDNDFNSLRDLFNPERVRISFLKKPKVAWALALSLASSLICLITTIVIALHNSSLPPEEPPAIGYMDPETGAVYPIMDVTGHEVYYIPPPQMMGNFQSVPTPCQPPSYESSVSSAHYSTAMTSTQYSIPGAPPPPPQFGWNK